MNVELTAEELLKALQDVSLATAESAPLVPDTAAPPHRLMRTVERAYGSTATRYGRRLSDLLAGSSAWNLFEKTSSRTAHLPRIHDLTRCEPLIRIMRDSGELDERERLIRERDEALVTAWTDSALADIDKREAEQAAYDRYGDELSKLTAVYRPYYQKLRRAAAAIPPLAAPRVRSRPLLMPPPTAALFGACHCDKVTSLTVLQDSASVAARDAIAMEYRQGRHAVTVGPASDRVAMDDILRRLDDMAWDVAAIAVCAFFARTSGSDPGAPFPLLIEDYFDWRGVDPRKRSVELRQEVDARIRLLCSDTLRLSGETELWIPDPRSGRRIKTAVLADGSFLTRQSDLFRQSAWQSDTDRGPLYGHMVALGPWARTFVTERAMIGLFPRRLAQYDLRRQQWERRIGWYLTFQMNNQGSKMRFDEVTDEGKKRLVVTPQHSLKMRTVLAGSHVHWEEMARTNPGKVIKQWCDTLETLRKDGIIGGYACLDGLMDGSDLPTRSRLITLLDYRYQFTPGTDQMKHLRMKAEARKRKLQAAAKRSGGGGDS